MLHGLELQLSVSVEFPKHLSPPFRGSGLEQALERVWEPTPHVEEQIEKADQSLQPPSNFEEKLVYIALIVILWQKYKKFLQGN